MWPSFERARVQRLGAAALRSVQKRREVPSKALAITLPEHGLRRARAQEGPEDLAITVPELCLRRAVAHARANMTQLYECLLPPAFEVVGHVEPAIVEEKKNIPVPVGRTHSIPLARRLGGPRYRSASV